MTPLMQQYYKIKSRFPDFIIFFRLGDFYEMFDKDAIECSKLLSITLTKRGEHDMCGIPYENIDTYIKKLVKQHRKSIAVCEQMERPEQARQNGRLIVKRDVTKKITPGTLVDFESYENNFVLTLKSIGNNFQLCWADIGTGDCFFDTCTSGTLLSHITKISPSQIVLNEKVNFEFQEWEDYIEFIDFHSTSTEIENQLLELISYYFKIYGYLFHPNVTKFDKLFFMSISNETLCNLEIFTSNGLLSFLDHTRTSMGKRVLIKNLKHPLCFKNLIEQKLDCIQFFINKINSTGLILLNILDIGKILNKIENIKELKKLCVNILAALKILNDMEKELPTYLLQKWKEIDIEHLILRIDSTIGESQFFNYIFITQEINQLSSLYKQRMKDIFNLPSTYEVACKVKENNIIGFYLETSIKNKVPHFFIRKQETQSGVRYTTKELLELEGEIAFLKEKIEQLNKNLLEDYKSQINNEKISIEKLSNLIGEIDYFQSCAYLSLKYNFTRPIFTEEKCLIVDEGEHPIMQNKIRFVKNNTNLCHSTRVMLITGPNMGGKSTYLRQNALIVFMSHCGMFVSCKSCTLSIFDNLFLRVGAHDSLYKNESTFMTEMLQCSEMIDKSTKNSFLVLDEVGRGTSTKDGLAISASIITWIHDHIEALTIVSTHYNELTQILELENMMYFKASHILDKYKSIKFLYKIEEGISESSFGIKVAEMSGLPKALIERSKQIFNNIKIEFHYTD